jgi:hypothetical protein
MHVPSLNGQKPSKSQPPPFWQHTGTRCPFTQLDPPAYVPVGQLPASSCATASVVVPASLAFSVPASPCAAASVVVRASPTSASLAFAVPASLSLRLGAPPHARTERTTETKHTLRENQIMATAPRNERAAFGCEQHPRFHRVRGASS